MAHHSARGFFLELVSRARPSRAKSISGEQHSLIRRTSMVRYSRTGPRFDDATFENTVYFKGAKFKEMAVFNRAAFKVGAYFQGVSFLPKEGFRGDMFGGVGFQKLLSRARPVSKMRHSRSGPVSTEQRSMTVPTSKV